MRTLEEIAARIKMLREDIESAKKRHESMTKDGHFGAASSEYTVIACADSMIKMLEWAMEGPSPAPAAWIRQVKHMIAYAEAMGFLTEDDEIPTDDIFDNLDRIVAQSLPAPPQADEVDCPDCRGFGAELTIYHGKQECPFCHGTGKAAEVTG